MSVPDDQGGQQGQDGVTLSTMVRVAIAGGAALLAKREPALVNPILVFMATYTMLAAIRILRSRA